MVIVSKIYKVAFKSFSLFYKCVKRLSSDISTCLHPLRKSHVAGDSRVLWLSNNALTICFALLNQSMCNTNA